MKTKIGESSNGRTDVFGASNLGSSLSSPADNKKWDRLWYLQTKGIREFEIQTIDGFVPIHEGENSFRIGSSEHKLRRQYLDFCALRHKQIVDEIVELAEKLAPKRKNLTPLSFAR